MHAFSYITRAFPPPRYMTLPSVGVDVSDTSLKYIQFRRHRKDLRLGFWGDIEIPQGVIMRGEVKDPTKLQHTLKKVKKLCDAEYIRLSLPEERAYLFETEIKRGTPYKDIRGLLEFRLEENVPLSPRDAFFDYDIVEDDTSTDVLRVSVTAYTRETIVRYYEACRAAELMPLSFEVEAQAIARASIREGDKGTYLIVDFGKMRTGLGIVHNASLMYTSTIDIGGRELSEALKSQFGTMSEDKYTKIKNEKGLQKTGEAKEVYTALSQPITTLKDQIAERIGYWHSVSHNKENRNIEKIILCGGSVNLVGFPEFLTEELGIPTERANVWQNAFSVDDYLPPITRRYSYGYATAVGLALKDFLR